MGQTHESPGGKTLGQRELQGHVAILIGGELGIEEGGLVQILAHLHLWLLFSLFAASRGWGFCILCHLCIGHHHSFLHDGFCHDHRFVIQETIVAPTGRLEHTGVTTVWSGDEVAVEMTEQQLFDIQTFPIHALGTAHLWIGGEVPRSGW